LSSAGRRDFDRLRADHAAVVDTKTGIDGIEIVIAAIVTAIGNTSESELCT
jgi:hypothetical protein